MLEGVYNSIAHRINTEVSRLHENVFGLTAFGAANTMLVAALLLLKDSLSISTAAC